MFAARLISQLKTTVMGMNSVDSKNAKRAAAAEMAESNPALAGLYSILPKRLKNSPELISLAASLLGHKGNQGNGSSDTSDIKSPYSNT